MAIRSFISVELSSDKVHSQPIHCLISCTHLPTYPSCAAPIQSQYPAKLYWWTGNNSKLSSTSSSSSSQHFPLFFTILPLSLTSADTVISSIIIGIVLLRRRLLHPGRRRRRPCRPFQSMHSKLSNFNLLTQLQFPAVPPSTIPSPE